MTGCDIKTRVEGACWVTKISGGVAVMANGEEKEGAERREAASRTDAADNRLAHLLHLLHLLHYFHQVFHQVVQHLPGLLSDVAMLKFWPSTPADLTPKAGPNGQERQINPFELSLAQRRPSERSGLSSSSSTSSDTGQQQQTANGPLTPTTPAYHHSLLSTPSHLLSPSASGSASSCAPALGPDSSLASGPLTPSAAPTAAAPTTSLSIHAPVFNMQQPPPPKNVPKQSPSQAPAAAAAAPAAKPAAKPSALSLTVTASSSASSSATSSPSRGQIHVKLIQARGLNVRSAHARPYVVVQFEQNEFIGRDPIDEAEKEVKGVPISRNPSSTALSALGAISSKINRQGSAPSSAGSKGSASHTPSSSVGSGKSAGLFGSRISAHNPVWKHEVSFDVTSDQSAITFNVYDRAVSDLGFLGTLQIKPVLRHEHTVDQWYKLQPYENETVTGEIRVQITFEASKTRRALTPRDFEFLKLIGRGTFGKVFQVRKKDTKRIYAMKVLSKREIIAKKEVAHTIGERKILQRSLESPFLVGLKFSFQTETDLYLVTDFKSGGELFWHLQRETRFSEDRARFYIAELILALEHLHKYDIVYRDLKPENILLDATGHVALCDFGLSKPDLRSDELTNTFCGTTEYLAPEVLLDEHGYSKLVDFWSLGVLLFEMCCGWSPFYAEDTQQMYKNICFGKIRFPKGVINEDGKQFVKGLLNRNPKHRLGAQRDAAELKEHPFFKSIDWEALARKQVTPPFKPVVESDESVANFDPEFTTADVRETGPDDIDLDDEDPSEDWVALSQSYLASSHTPNGPLGSDRPPLSLPPPLSQPSLQPQLQSQSQSQQQQSQQQQQQQTGTTTTQPRSIEVPQRRKKKDVVGTPLTNSVQENFRGFTYHGESVMPDGVASFLVSGGDENNNDEYGNGEVNGEGGENGENGEYGEGEGEDGYHGNGNGVSGINGYGAGNGASGNGGMEDDLSDLESPVGRYAQQRRAMQDGLDDGFGM
ncbi:kinase-like protein [Panus rudis PR-1116 ss-1]|nr:kinase-like protein [Panus rudis PR-1116 ss-1]